LISLAVAGALFVTVGLQGVVLVDFVTDIFAVLTLLVVRIPRPKLTAEGQAGKGFALPARSDHSELLSEGRPYGMK